MLSSDVQINCCQWVIVTIKDKYTTEDDLVRINRDNRVADSLEEEEDIQAGGNPEEEEGNQVEDNLEEEGDIRVEDNPEEEEDIRVENNLEEVEDIPVDNQTEDNQAEGIPAVDSQAALTINHSSRNLPML